MPRAYSICPKSRIRRHQYVEDGPAHALLRSTPSFRARVVQRKLWLRRRSVLPANLREKPRQAEARRRRVHRVHSLRFILLPDQGRIPAIDPEVGVTARMVCSNDDTTGLSGFCARMAQRGGPQADTEEDAVAMAIATDTAEDRILRQA